MPRTRMVLVAQRTRLKNRLHATLDKYALSVKEVSDLFGKKGRELLRQAMQQLPPETRFSAEQTLEALEELESHIEAFEERMREVFEETGQACLLQTIPGIGPILSTVIVGDVGEVERFLGAPRLASYSGTVPRVAASGGKAWYGRLRRDVNQYLKRIFIEAANCVCLQRKRRPGRHVSQLYERLRARKGHGKAIGAVARHLAEATYWVLKKKVPYRDPSRSPAVLPTKG